MVTVSEGRLHPLAAIVKPTTTGPAMNRHHVLLDGDHVTIYSPTGSALGHLHIDWTQIRQQLRPAA
jgi:hypothetical protein